MIVDIDADHAASLRAMMRRVPRPLSSEFGTLLVHVAPAPVAARPIAIDVNRVTCRDRGASSSKTLQISHEPFEEHVPVNALAAISPRCRASAVATKRRNEVRLHRWQSPIVGSARQRVTRTAQRWMADRWSLARCASFWDPAPSLDGWLAPLCSLRAEAKTFLRTIAKPARRRRGM